MTNYKICIVDDMVDNIQIISNHLEQLHPEYRLFQSTNVDKAIIIAEQSSVDLIIADWDMPDKDGIELTRSIKLNPKTKHIPVIIVTGVMINSSNLSEALTVGAHDYLIKPVDAIELAARVNSALTLVKCHLKELEMKNVELVEKTLILIKNHEFNLEIQKKLHHLIEIFHYDEAKDFVQNIIDELDEKIRQDSWQKFEVAFQSVHNDFNKKLLSFFPNITPAELKLSMLIKLGLNIKETSTLLYQSPESLKVALSRLRKKLQIKTESNLYSFLASF